MKAHLEEELSNAEFSALPFHYYITAQLLIKEAGFDDSGGDEKVLRRLLQDLREIRQAKIRQGCQLEDFASDTTGEAYLQVNNMALMEANEIRPFLRRAFSQFNRFSLLGKINNEEFP